MASNGRRNGPGRRSPAGTTRGGSRPPAAGRKSRSRTAASASVRPDEPDDDLVARDGGAGSGKGGSDASGSGAAGAGKGGSGSSAEARSDGEPRRRSPITKRAAVLALVVAALVVSYASSLRAWLDQRSQIAELEQAVAERRDNVQELERELDRWQDPAYVKAQARQRFGWVEPGETGYVVIGQDGRTPNQQSEPDKEPQQQSPWWQSLWGSVENAGNPPPPKDDEKQRREPAKKIGP